MLWQWSSSPHKGGCNRTLLPEYGPPRTFLVDSWVCVCVCGFLCFHYVCWIEISFSPFQILSEQWLFSMLFLLCAFPWTLLNIWNKQPNALFAKHGATVIQDTVSLKKADGCSYGGRGEARRSEIGGFSEAEVLRDWLPCRPGEQLLKCGCHWLAGFQKHGHQLKVVISS